MSDRSIGRLARPRRRAGAGLGRQLAGPQARRRRDRAAHLRALTLPLRRARPARDREGLRRVGARAARAVADGGDARARQHHRLERARAVRRARAGGRAQRDHRVHDAGVGDARLARRAARAARPAQGWRASCSAWPACSCSSATTSAPSSGGPSPR
ncbi:MAG: hypothetical protein MZW92_33080 [Comamonadaceae bacterium]|nr:hypothetical protein [Comamonadaceae bacterium]